MGNKLKLFNFGISEYIIFLRKCFGINLSYEKFYHLFKIISKLFYFLN